MLDSADWSFNLRGNTSRRGKLGFESSVGVNNSGAMGRGWRGGMKVSYRPSSRVQVETEPSYQSQPDAAQYVAATGDVGYAPTYGVTSPSGASCVGGRLPEREPAPG